MQKLHILEESHLPPPTCSDGIHAYPVGDHSATKKLVLIYHHEGAFHSNDGLQRGWLEKGKWPLKLKDQGRGLMVTDFNGYLQLNEEEIERARLFDPTIPLMAREVLVFGA